jgi:hypothetical protein
MRIYVYANVRVYVYACVRARARVRARVCVRACVCACVCVRVCEWVGVGWVGGCLVCWASEAQKGSGTK